MKPDDRPDPDGWLQFLGIDSLCQWDVLVFLYRHQVSLVSAEHIARLVGYDAGGVVTALDGLESLDLVSRSRVSQAVRLYQFTRPPDPRRRTGLDRLLLFAQGRAGRLSLARKLLRNPPLSNDDRSRLPRKEGRRPWLRAI
jgi:MarR family